MKKITDLIEKGELILPQDHQSQTMQVEGWINGEWCNIEITKNYISVLTHEWIRKNMDKYQWGLEPKLLGQIGMAITTNLKLSDIGEKTVCKIKTEGIEEFEVNAVLAQEKLVFDRSGGYKCIYYCWPVL